MDGIIHTTLGFILSVSVIQGISVFQLITNIESCQSPLPIMGLLASLLEEEAINPETWLLNIIQISLSYSIAIRASHPTLISPPSSPTSLNGWIA